MVIEKAKELGQALIDSPQFRAYTAARDEMDGDLAASNLMRSYAEKEQEITGLLQKKDADRDEIARLSKQLQLLRDKINANEILTYYMKVREEFQELLNRANSVIAHFIDPDRDEESEGGCGGGCSSGCAGCGKH